MRKILILFAVLAFLSETTSNARDSLSLKVADSVSLKVQDSVAISIQDSTKLVSTPKTAEQMLVEMQQQLKMMQEQLNQMQNAMCAPKKPKELIPVKSKSTSKFYWSLQFGFFLTSAQYYEGESKQENLGTRFSYAIKPAFGYLFTDRMTLGCKIIFADCQFAGMPTSSTFKYLIANALIGGGASLSDYMTWRIQPYFRYRITHIIWDRLNLWGEVSAYIGQNIPRDTKTHKLQWQERSTVYGIALSPTITIDLNRNLMLFSTMDLLAWNGSYKVSGNTSLQNNSFNFQIIPIFTVLTGFFNLGVIKRF